MKTILISGATSGFGKGVAEKLINEDYIVYAAGRRLENMKDLEEKGARILKMDVTSTDEVNAAIDLIMKEHGRLDAVLANAGFGSYGMIESLSMEDIQYQYDVNVFGVARLVKAAMPHMRKQGAGRVVITTSVVSHISTLGMGWYASTKHAVNAMAVALRQEVKAFGVDVIMIEPGAVRTEFENVALDSMHKVDHAEDYMPYVNGFDKYVRALYKKSPGPESTIKAMVEALTARTPKTVYRTTTDARMLPKVRNLLTDKKFDSFVLSSIK